MKFAVSVIPTSKASAGRARAWARGGEPAHKKRARKKSVFLKRARLAAGYPLPGGLENSMAGGRGGRPRQRPARAAPGSRSGDAGGGGRPAPFGQGSAVFLAEKFQTILRKKTDDFTRMERYLFIPGRNQRSFRAPSHALGRTSRMPHSGQAHDDHRPA